MDYYFDEEVKSASLFNTSNLKLMQILNMDIEEIFEVRRGFSKDEWSDLIIRLTGTS